MATQTGKDPSQDEEFLSQLYKGGELLAAGKVVEAKDHLERAFKLHPKNEKAQNLLGLTYFKLGLFDRASEIYELLVRENPADPTLRVNLGLVYLKTNNLPRAVKEFETSTDLEPTHKKAHNYLGLALAQSGDYARAREHFVIAGSDAMAEKMGRAIAAGAKAPVAVAVAPPPSAPQPPVPSAAELVDKHMVPPPLPPVVSEMPEVPEAAEVVEASEEPEASELLPGEMSGVGKPPVPSFDVLVMPETPATEVLEVTSEDDVQPDDEIIPAEALLKPKSSPPGAEGKLAEAARQMGGAQKSPLPPAGYEEVPVPSPSSPVGKAMRNDWGAQFGMDEAPPPPPEKGTNGSGDDMRFAEDEGPSAMPMPEPVATSEAAVATGAQVPMEAVERSTETWDTMPVVEASAEEMMVEVDVPIPAPTVARVSDMGLSDAAEQEQVVSAEIDMPPEEAPDLPPGLNYTGAPPTVDVPMSEGGGELPASDAQGADAGAAVEMFPSAEGDPYATQESWGEEQPQDQQQEQHAPAEDQGSNPDWLTTQGGGEEQQQFASGETSEEDALAYQAASGEMSQEQQAYEEAPAYEQPAYEQAPDAVPITGEVPTTATDLAMPAGESSQGYSPMNAPRLEELGPSATLGFSPGEMAGPFNLSADGLALSVNGELLTRMPNLLAVVGSLDATPELRRSRGRQTDQPFGAGEEQLQRVVGAGVIHLEPGGFTYQAIDLADEGAYVREERVFAFEEAVAFENARLTGVGNIGVDVVHLKGQGKVLLRLDGALKAMAIPPGTPLKVPLARLVGWYGYVSVRVMGFVGQGAVELTGDGYVLLAA